MGVLFLLLSRSSWVYTDPSFTPAPNDIKLDDGWWISFWALAELGFPSGRERALGTPLPSPRLSSTEHPDEHLLCYDFLYFAVARHTEEWERDFSPAWRFVGRHTHWTERIVNIANSYLRRIFEVPDLNDDIPTVRSPFSRFRIFFLCVDVDARFCFMTPPDLLISRFPDFRTIL